MSLSKIIRDIKAECEKLRHFIKRPRKRYTPKLYLARGIASLYSDSFIIFERIERSVRLIKRYTPAKCKTEKQIERHFYYTERLMFDIKSLYLWLYKLKVLLAKSSLSSKLDLKELKRILLIRHNYLIHVPHYKSGSMRPRLQTVARWHKYADTIELLYFPFFVRDYHYRGISSLKRKLLKYIPELRDENNYMEIIIIIYKNLNKIKDKGLQRSAKEFICEKGIATERPSILALCLLNIIRQILYLMKIK